MADLTPTLTYLYKYWAHFKLVNLLFVIYNKVILDMPERVLVTGAFGQIGV